jgi:hypothetical protein
MFAAVSQFRATVGAVVRTALSRRGNLQAIDQSSPITGASWLESREARRFACLCSIIVDRSGRGSGFLIADDLVMTNYHVIFDKENGEVFDPSRIKCRLNFFEDGQFEDDEHDWIALPGDRREAFVATSRTAPGDEILSVEEKDYLDSKTGARFLDYAILRLTTPVGKGSGQTSLNFEVRPLGWIATEPAPTARIGQKLSVFQFPERVSARGSFSQESLQTSSSQSVRIVANGLRARYDASTRHGSSGSPVFDGVKLVGIHNAGQETGDGSAENQFVPINCILEDIDANLPKLHAQLLETKPPLISKHPSGRGAELSDRARSAVEERVRAAAILIDRDEQNDLIQVKFRGQGAAVYVNHVVARENDDEVERFVERIKVGAAQSQGVPSPDFIERYLRGSSAAESAVIPWREAGMTWPKPNTPLQQAREAIFNGLQNNQFSPRTLIVLYASNLAKRSPEEEVAYMQILGEECAKYVLSKSVDKANSWQALQALVVYKYSLDTKINLSPIAPLWTSTPPAHCGVSFPLPKVTRDDIEAWRVNVNAAWRSFNSPIEFPKQFKPDVEFYMAEVVSMLKDPITKAAMALLSGETETDTP